MNVMNCAGVMNPLVSVERTSVAGWPFAGRLLVGQRTN